jgi:hypothetical protein
LTFRYSGEIPVAFVVLSAAAKKLIEDGKAEMEIKAEIQKVLQYSILWVWILRSSWQYVSDHKVKDKWLTGGVRFVDSVPKVNLHTTEWYSCSHVYLRVLVERFFVGSSGMVYEIAPELQRRLDIHDHNDSPYLWTRRFAYESVSCIG